MKRREFITLLGGGGDMAACGARAAGGEAADDRVPGRDNACVAEPIDRCLNAQLCVKSREGSKSKQGSPSVSN